MLNPAYYTTLNKIRGHSPCEDGWEKLLKSLNKTKPDDEPIHLTQVLESNGVQDTLWCFRALDDFEAVRKPLVLFLCDTAERVLPIFEQAHPNDSRARECIEITRRWLNGEATIEEVEEATARAAWAAEATARAAWAAAWAAETAAWAAETAARAAETAARAAWAAARAAWAAETAEIEKQRRGLIEMMTTKGTEQ